MSKNLNQDRYLSGKVLTELKYVGVDFDNTIARKIWPHPGIGEPMPGVEEGLRAIYEMGFTIFVFTARPYADIKPIKNWLKDHNLEQYIEGVICGKPLFRLIIDDSAYRFQGDWVREMQGIKHALHERAHP